MKMMGTKIITITDICYTQQKLHNKYLTLFFYNNLFQKGTKNKVKFVSHPTVKDTKM